MEEILRQCRQIIKLNNPDISVEAIRLHVVCDTITGKYVMYKYEEVLFECVYDPLTDEISYMEYLPNGDMAHVYNLCSPTIIEILDRQGE